MVMMKKLTMMKMYGGDSQNLKEMKRLGIVDTVEQMYGIVDTVEQMYGIIATLNNMKVETTPADKNNNFAARVTVSNLIDFGETEESREADAAAGAELRDH
ncbi:hypothetical protein WN943_015749 [Citrus x changshan-huyou]